MNFAREGYPYIAIATVLAASAYALALSRRSFPLWLLAFALTVVAVGVSYRFRTGSPAGSSLAAR